MKQLTFFETEFLANQSNENFKFSLEKVINIASVPHRSPFRYPGGKTWLVPYIRRWLKSLPVIPVEFIEPFCGGGIVSLSVAFEELAKHVKMVELDEQVAAVWQTILSENGIELAENIAAFELTSENIAAIFANPPLNLQDKAFQTIIKNRVNRGGILAPGAGRLKEGENGKGLKSRWYPQTLKKRIYEIVEIRERFEFIENDGLEFLRQKTEQVDAVFFVDPPYTVQGTGKKAGSRLYTHSELDHDELFRVVSTLKGDFLMTYDNTEDVKRLAQQYNFDLALVPMKTTHHKTLNELLIGRNLGWIRT